MQSHKKYFNWWFANLFLLFWLQPSYCQTETLYYSVENITDISFLTTLGKAIDSEEFIKYISNQTSSIKSRQDNFLIPYIITQIDLNTNFYEIKKMENAASTINDGLTLKIAINTFNNVIEYQFKLIQKDNKNDSCLLNQTSFFINPEDPNYPNIIVTEIQKLFKGNHANNLKPEAKILIDGDLGEIDTTYFRSNLDTIHLDGTASKDFETPKKYLNYRWSVTNDSNDSIYLTDFNFETSKQNLVIEINGTYTFSLVVSDGVMESDKDSVKIKIKVLTKPALKLNQSKFEKITQNNIIYWGKSNIFQKYTLDFIINNEVPESKLMIRYLYSQNSYKIFSYKVDQGMQNKSIELCSANPIDSSLVFKPNYISGLTIHSSNSNTKSIIFETDSKMPPGEYKYVLYTDYNSVTSNFDTLNFVAKEKSLCSISIGYNRFKVTQATDYFNGFAISALKFGLRCYITPRISAEINPLLQLTYKDYSVLQKREIGTNALMGQINIDVFPWNPKNLHLGENPAYLTGFVSFYQFGFSNSLSTIGIRQWGLGIKPRAQLFVKNPKLGTIYSEFEVGYYSEFKHNPFHTIDFGFNLIYGLWNY